jgi:glutamine synthetase
LRLGALIHLAFAVILMSGLDGVENKIDPGEPTSHNLFHLTEGERKEMGIESLPGSLKEALDYLETDSVVRDALGEHVFCDFMSLGRAEWDAYRIQVHQWELDRYLNTV